MRQGRIILADVSEGADVRRQRGRSTDWGVQWKCGCTGLDTGAAFQSTTMTRMLPVAALIVVVSCAHSALCQTAASSSASLREAVALDPKIGRLGDKAGPMAQPRYAATLVVLCGSVSSGFWSPRPPTSACDQIEFQTFFDGAGLALCCGSRRMAVICRSAY